MSDFNFTPGHLTKDSEGKINNVLVKNGNLIYSEKSGLQFIDYADKRHTYGSVLTGVYNDTAFVDFTTSTLETSLEAIKSNGFVVDGQIIKVGNLIYKYRKIGDNNFIIKMDESTNVDINDSKAGFIVYLPEFVSGDMVDINFLVSVFNKTNTTKVFLVKIVNNEIDLASCQDLDGMFDAANFDLTITHNDAGLFVITSNIASTLKVVSYSVSSSGSSKNEGLYVVASDL